MTDAHRRIHIGAAQVSEVYLDKEATVEKDCEYIRRAGELGLDLVVFPEFHIPAAPHWFRYDERPFLDFYEELFDNAVTVPGPAVDHLCEAAGEAETAVVMGVTERAPETAGTMYNSQVFIDVDGCLIGTRRKLVPTMYERLFHGRGTGADVRTFASEIGNLGGLMCGEHTNHLASYAILAQGEDVHAAAWPAFPWVDREVRNRRLGIRSRFHAYAGGVPTASAASAVNQKLADVIGHPHWEGRGGGSAVIAANGQYIAGPDWSGEGIVHGDIDLGKSVRSRAVHDVTGHYNRFDIFDLTVHRGETGPLRFEDEPPENGPPPG